MDPSEEIKTSGSLTEALASDLVVDPSFAREQLRTEQSVPMAVLTGGFAALIGAIGWAIVTATTHFQIGLMAVGVGFLVGLAVRQFGKGFTPVFGVIGAAWSLAGCALGNLMAVCAMAAASGSVSFFTILAKMNPVLAARVLGDTFQPMDVLFYGIAIYEGYRLSIRRLTKGDIAKVTGG